MLLTYYYIDNVPDVPDTSGESKNNIGRKRKCEEPGTFQLCTGWQAMISEKKSYSIPYAQMLYLIRCKI